MKLAIVLVGLYFGVLLADAYSDPIKIADKLSESFESLSAPNGSTVAFVQGKSVKGWWSSEVQFITSDGSSNVGGLYSFGSSSDRALGAINSLKTKTVVFGISIISDVEIHEVEIKFTGEQWRYGGNVPDTNVLSFDYSVLTTAQYQDGGWGANIQSTAPTSLWIQVPEFSFQGQNSSVVGPVRFSEQFSRSISTRGMGPDKVLQLRWTARANHDGLAIDDFEVHATTASTSGDGPAQGKWKILAIAGWSALGAATLAVVVVAANKWKKHMRVKRAMMMGEPFQGVYTEPFPSEHAPGLYRAFEPNEKQRLIQ